MPTATLTPLSRSKKRPSAYQQYWTQLAMSARKETPWPQQKYISSPEHLQISRSKRRPRPVSVTITRIQCSTSSDTHQTHGTAMRILFTAWHTCITAVLLGAIRLGRFCFFGFPSAAFCFWVAKATPSISLFSCHTTTQKLTSAKTRLFITKVQINKEHKLCRLYNFHCSCAYAMCSPGPWGEVHRALAACEHDLHNRENPQICHKNWWTRRYMLLLVYQASNCHTSKKYCGRDRRLLCCA